MQPTDVSFALIPQFSMIALYSALEPLRVVNRFRPGRFAWRFVSVDGAPVKGSNGIAQAVSGSLANIGRPDLAVLCSSYEHGDGLSRPVINDIRRLARSGALLAGLDTGAFYLAEAGVLDGHQATCHWETLPALRESYQRIDVRDAPYVIDRGRMTASGGTTALDMMLDWIGALEGKEMERKVADTLVYSGHRKPSGVARISAAARYGITDQRLQRVVEVMETHCEDVLAMTDLAAVAGVSVRQLERLFEAEQAISPVQFYLQLRLERAEHLLTYTRMSVRDVGLACGFSSLSSFSRRYSARHGFAPSLTRWVG